MSISFVAFQTGANSTSNLSVQVGDLLLAWAFRDGNTGAPTVPAGWNILNNAAGANTCGSALAWKYATSTSQASGTWTNATSLVIQAYRSTSGKKLSPGAFSQSGGSSTTINYPALTLLNPFGNSWLVGFAGHRSVNVAVETPPSGMTNRSTVVDATDEAAGHDTNGAVSSWSSTNVTGGGTSSGYRVGLVEVFEIDDTVGSLLNANDKSATISLDATKLVATNTGTATPKAVRATVPILPGEKKVFAATLTTLATGEDMEMGMAAANHPLTTRLSRVNTTAFGIDDYGEVWFNDSAFIGTIDPAGYTGTKYLHQGDKVFWALDRTLEHIFVGIEISGVIQWNGGPTGNPDTDVSDWAIPAEFAGRPIFPILAFHNVDGVWTFDPSAAGHGLTTYSSMEGVAPSGGVPRPRFLLM